jgi:hypothetical protein
LVPNFYIPVLNFDFNVGWENLTRDICYIHRLCRDSALLPK